MSEIHRDNIVSQISTIENLFKELKTKIKNQDYLSADIDFRHEQIHQNRQSDDSHKYNYKSQKLQFDEYHQNPIKYDQINYHTKPNKIQKIYSSNSHVNDSYAEVSSGNIKNININESEMNTNRKYSVNQITNNQSFQIGYQNMNYEYENFSRKYLEVNKNTQQELKQDYDEMILMIRTNNSQLRDLKGNVKNIDQSIKQIDKKTTTKKNIDKQDFEEAQANEFSGKSELLINEERRISRMKMNESANKPPKSNLLNVRSVISEDNNIPYTSQINTLNTSYFKTNLNKDSINSKEKLQNLKKYISQNARKALSKIKVNPKEIMINFDYQNNLLIYEHEKGFLVFDYANFNNMYISEDSDLNQFWNIIILLILMYHIILSPFIFFSETWIEDQTWYKESQMFVELAFIIDILQNFFTSYKNQQGHEEKNFYKIAMNYLKGWFCVDLVSSFPIHIMLQFNLLNTDINISYLKLIKIPRQLLMSRFFANNFQQRFVNLEQQITVTSSEYNLQVNSLKQISQFIYISTFLVCITVSQTFPCLETCDNWFFGITQTEQINALDNKNHSYHSIALDISTKYADDLHQADLAFQNYSYSHRYQVQANAFQFVLQTVTTVGYGDVSSQSTNERLFRSLCMIIGVIMFTLASSTLLQTTISESFNIQKSKENEMMIEKLQIKQNIKGTAKRFLELLGDSVQTEKLEKELEFIRLLPDYMSQMVLSTVWERYTNKIDILTHESINMFIEFMRISSFRRCVIDELIFNEEEIISIVYSGQLGCQVNNLRHVMNDDQLFQVQVGQEIGQHQFIEQPKSKNNQIYVCRTNMEIIEIDLEEQLLLIKKSSKGNSQIEDKIMDFLVNLQIIISIQFGMISKGIQVDFRWQKRTVSLLKIDINDRLIMTRLYEQILHNMRTVEDKRSDRKWQFKQLDDDILNQIITKAKFIIIEMIPTRYKEILDSVSKWKVNKIIKNKSSV